MDLLNDDYYFTCSAPLSPMEPSDAWVHDLLIKSAPLTTCNSFTGQSFLSLDPIPDVNTEPELRYFPSQPQQSDPEFASSSGSSSSSPHIKSEVTYDKVPDLSSLHNKLELIRKNNDLTPKSLESIFDTKDILKDEDVPISRRRTQANGSLVSSTFSNSEANSSKSSSPSSPTFSKPRVTKKRAHRKRLTETQKQAHNKIEKKYRININTKIAALQKIIPWVAYEKTAFETGKEEDNTPDNHCNRLNKSMILEKATDYILYLQKNEERILQENLELKKEIMRLGGNVN
jgi:Helix-loop-helix DNA-binding domain.